MSTKIVRDPNTGRFRRADGPEDTDEREVITARVISVIPPADLTSGTDVATVTGSDAEIVDFTDLLENDEVFVAHRIAMGVQLAPGETATAEHTYRVRYLLRGDVGDFLPGGPVQSVGIVDLQQSQIDDHDVIFAGYVAGAGDHRDTVTGTGGGAMNTRVDHVVEYPGLELPAPGWDRDDELTVPHRIVAGGSDDQAFRVEFTLHMVGTIYDF